MSRHYHDERRKNEVGYLPNLVVERMSSFEHDGPGRFRIRECVWYYHFSQPGCLPDSDFFGPFETKEEAMEHARLDLEDDNEVFGAAFDNQPDICDMCDGEPDWEAFR